MSESQFPPFVYAPVTERDGETHLVMNQVDDGRTAVFVYSAIDRLHAMYEAGHPWVVASPDSLSRAHAEVPYDVLLLDTVLERREPPAAATSSDSPRGVFVAGASPVAARNVEE